MWGKPSGKSKPDFQNTKAPFVIKMRNRRIARHFNTVGHDVCTLRFQGIEVANPLIKRGGDRDKVLLQREA